MSFAEKKKLSKKYLLLIIFIILHNTIYAQTEKLSELVISIAEELAADDTDPEATSAYIERLYELSEDPVELNSATQDELSRIFFLSDFQVKALADYIHASGKIISVYEVVNIPGFDKETVEMIIPFIILKNKENISTDSSRWKNTSITNLSVRSGKGDTTYLGSPLKILSKYKFTSGSFSGGLTAEKDPGEKFFSTDPPLPDFLSAYLAISGKGLIRKLVVGDYSARFGQGTNINNGIRTGLSLISPGYMSASSGIRPYTSTDENNFFRGAAAELSFKNLAASFFYSGNSIDATPGTSSGISEDYIENIYLAGIHNTSSLLLKKDKVYEQVYGTDISYNFNNLRVGLIWSENRFSLPVHSTNTHPEGIFDFSGQKNRLFSLYYNGLIKRILLYGEISADQNKKTAFVQGMSFRPSDRLIINFLYRNYVAGYVSFHGKGPGSSASTGNQESLLGNFTFEAARHLFISSGCDIQKFAWLKYRCSAPSHAIRKEIRLKILPTGKTTIDASYNYRSLMTDASDTRGIPLQKETVTRSIKCSVRHIFNDNLILATRIDYRIVCPSFGKGMLLLQDLNYRFRKLPVTLWFRYCLFNTESWDSRIYTYENDLLYSFSIPALSGEGSRSYFMAKYEISDIAEIRLKYGITSFTDSNTTYQDRNEIKFQFRVWF